MPADQLTPVFRDKGFRDRFREDLKNPVVGTIFKGTWEQVFIGATAKAENAALQNRTVAEVAAERGVDPLDFMLDLALEEDLETAFLGKFLNVGDEGVEGAPSARTRRSLSLRRRRTSDLYVRCRLRTALTLALGP